MNRVLFRIFKTAIDSVKRLEKFKFELEIEQECMNMNGNNS